MNLIYNKLSECSYMYDNNDASKRKKIEIFYYRKHGAIT